MAGPLGSDTNAPALDAGTNALTQHKPPVPLGIGLSIGPLISEQEKLRAFTQFNLHSVDGAKLRLLARKLAADLGGQDRISSQYHYLEGALGARLLRAFYKTAQKVALEPAFLMAVAFAEGLNRFVDLKLKHNPKARPDSYSDIGMDRFLKESYRLKSYLPDDFGYSTRGSVANEKGEVVTLLLFQDIESAIAALGAMLADRQRSVEMDLGAFGVQPPPPGSDELCYWTYVYYNAGSGPPSDPKGTGRGHLAKAAKSAAGLAIPKQKFQEPGQVGQSLGNAQRVIGTMRVLLEAGVQRL
jgi:hypothetical protein